MRKKISVSFCIWGVVFLVGCSSGSNNYRNESNENNKHSQYENENNIESSVINAAEYAVFETNNPNIFENELEESKGNTEETKNIRETRNAKKEAGDTKEAENVKEVKEHEDSLLTLDRVLELSEKEKLDWLDFDGYACKDIGSGLMILKYDIDADFYLIVGGTGQGEPMYVRLVSAQNKEDFIELGKKNKGDVEHFIREKRSIPYYVSIIAHIKEIDENSILISSDTDVFPGVFSVTYDYEEMGDEGFEELKEGECIRILMKNITQAKVEEKLNDNKIPVYEAIEIMAWSDEDLGQEDILLTGVPELSLIDPLSSRYNSFSVKPENYTWTVEKNGNEEQTIACGAAPLDESKFRGKGKLKIPRYSMDYVFYNYSTKILPDILTVRQWNISDLGDNEAREEKIVVYYDKMGFIELQKDKIYEFTAEWMKENFQKNKFYGAASYVVVTE